MRASVAKRSGGASDLRVGPNPVRTPQHWHVTAEWYVAELENGSLSWATTLAVVTNDVTLAVAYMRRQIRELEKEGAPQRNKHHVGQMLLCSEESHLDSLPKELIARAER